MKIVGLFLALVLMLSLASVALARGAPTKQKAFTDQAVVSVHVAPVVANVPPLATGFDVILNISPATFRAGNAKQDATDTSARGSRSTTVAERGYQAASYSARSGPNIVTGLRL